MKSTSRSRFLRAAAAAAALPALAPLAHAQGADAYPNRSVRVVVPFAPGGALDTVARLVAGKLAERLGQPFVVENKPGAANVIGNDTVAKAAPDGYTLLFAAAPLALNTALGMKLPYDPFTDFAPISLVATIPALIVTHPGTPYRTLKDVVDAARAKPGGLNYATAGVGSMPHLLGEALRTKAGVPLAHIGYKGAAPALQDAIAGTVPIFIDAYIPTGTQVVAGKLRAIAIASEKRSPVLPDVPTTAEQGYPELVGNGFYGLLAPAKTPPAIVEKLHAAVVDAVNKTDVRERLVQMGYDVPASTPAQYTAYVKREIDRWTPVVKAAGIRPE
ncbi:MAG: tripartite tricarboxylate transporter substrate binding protein [Burkholderiaceae bacterium]